MPSRNVLARALTGVLCVLAAGAVVSAPAGVPLVDTKGVPYRWDLDLEQPNVVGGRVTFYVDPRGTTDTISGTKSASQAVRDGVRAWEVATARIRFTEDAARPATGRSTTDRVNWIGWANGTLGPFTFAATFPTRSDSQILDMDVVLNEGFTWNTRTPGLADVADIESLVAHEWGHAIGNDHVPLRQATMYFSSEAGMTSLRTLSADDTALVGSAYPNATFGATTGTLAGRVDVEGTKDDRAALVVAVSVASAEPVASAFTAPDGTFAIRGLPAGTYRTLVVPPNPLGESVNSFWRTGNTGFLPAVATSSPGNPAPLLVVAVEAGKTALVPDVSVSPKTPPREPDDSRAQATWLRVGDAYAGRIEEPDDEDWFAFDLAQGERVSISLLAWGLGADCDPEFSLYGPTQQVITSVRDVRSGPSVHFFPEGDDLDARLLAYQAASTGTHAVRVLNETHGTGSRAFYVLAVTPTSDAPSPSLTRAEARPDRIDADGTSTATLAVRPVREDGTDVGPGATVEFLHDGAGSVGPATYAGNGEYVATLTAPTAPAREPFAVRVTTSAGTATVTDAATVVYVGPVDGGASTITATPRRIAADGAERTTLRFVPRDAQGEPLGAGRTVVFLPSPALGIVVGNSRDLGDGSYEAEATAGTTEGAADLGAYLSGSATGNSARLALGFGLGEVLAQARTDVAAFRATPGLPRAARKALASAATRIDAGLAAVAAGPAKEARAVAQARAASAPLATALRKAKGALVDPGTGTEIARALRAAASSAIARAVVGGPKDQKRLDQATARLAEGDDAFAAGDPAGAAALWGKAHASVVPLLP